MATTKALELGQFGTDLTVDDSTGAVTIANDVTVNSATSTGIDDNADQTVITIANDETVTIAGNLEVSEIGNNSTGLITIDVDETAHAMLRFQEAGSDLWRIVKEPTNELVIDQGAGDIDFTFSTTGDFTVHDGDVIIETGGIKGPSVLYIDPATYDTDSDAGSAAGTVRIRGDLIVDGDTTTINSTTLTVDDKNITLASGAANAAAADGAGLTVDDGSSGTEPTILYGSTSNSFNFNRNVGINTTISGGTTADTYLHIYSDESNITPLIKLQNNTAENDSSEGVSIDFVGSGDKTAIGSRIIGTRAAAGANMDLRFHTARDAFAMIIDESQQVGVGTTDPSLKLDVATSSGAAGSFNRHIALTRGTTVGGSIGTYRAAANNDVDRMTLGIGTAATLTVTDLGRVGIGTDIPSELFHAYKAADDYLLYGSNPRLWLTTPAGINGLRVNGDTTPFEFEITSGSYDGAKFTMGSTGDVSLVGVDTSGADTFNDSPNFFLNATRWNGSANVTNFQGTIRAHSRSATNADGYLGIGANANANHIAIDASSGNVGVGTTSPDLKLHVGGVNAYPASSGTTPAGFISIRAKDLGGTHGANIGVAPAAPWGTWIQGQDANNLATNYPLLLNPNGGNVGIGKTNPSAKLEVEGAFAGILSKFFDTGSNGGQQYNGGPVVGISRVGNGSVSLAGPLFQVGNDTSSSTSYNIDEAIFTVTNTGVGAGETDPEAKFHVKNDISADGDTYNNPLMILQNGRVNTSTGASTLRFDTNEITAGAQYQRAAISAEYDDSNNLNGRLLFGTADTANVLNTHLKIKGDGAIEVPTRGMSARYVSSPANYYPGATSYWIRVYYREYQTPNAFGFNAVELKCIAAGRTDGRGSFARMLINHKQQQASDQYSIAVLEKSNFEIAAKFTASGGSTSDGILEVWVKPNASYQSVTVHGFVRGPTNQSTSSSAGNIIAETTNSSTQPSGSVLLRAQNDVGHLMYRGNGGNPSRDYQGLGSSRIYYDSGTGVGGSSNSQQNNDQMFYSAYESYGMNAGPLHPNGNWYAGIGTASWNGDKWVKYAVAVNGHDRLVATARFTNFSDSTNRTGTIEYSLDGGATWSVGNSVTYGSSSGSETTFTLNETGWNERGLHHVLFKFKVNGTGSTTGIGIGKIDIRAYGGDGASISVDNAYKETAGFTSYQGIPWIKNNLGTTKSNMDLWDSVHRQGGQYIHTLNYSGTGATSGFSYYITAQSSSNTYWHGKIEEFSWIHTNGGNYNTFLSGVCALHSAYASTLDTTENYRHGEGWYGALSMSVQHNSNGNQLILSKVNGNSGNLSGGFGTMIVRSQVPLRIRASSSWI